MNDVIHTPAGIDALRVVPSSLAETRLITYVGIDAVRVAPSSLAEKRLIYQRGSASTRHIYRKEAVQDQVR